MDYTMSSSILHIFYYAIFLSPSVNPCETETESSYLLFAENAAIGSLKAFNELLELMIPVNSNFEDS